MNDSVKHKTVWIIGGGKFGFKAAQALLRRQPHSRVTVVDRDPDVCRRLDAYDLSTVCADGADFLIRGLKKKPWPDWILPVIPEHLAFEYIRFQLAATYDIRPVDIPDAVTEVLPHPAGGTKGKVFMSLADFTCPEDCPEPADICTYTGKKRPYRLYERLSRLQIDGFISVVVRSRQLLPGVGGYRPAALAAATETIAPSIGLPKASVAVILISAISCE